MVEKKALMRVTGDHLYIPDPYLGSTLKANAQCYIERQVTHEHVYTNDRGWRVCNPKQTQNAQPCDIALIGCSWAMGEAVEYEDTFAHHIANDTGQTLANLGVGSYSLLQAYRRLEREITFVKPKIVIVSFGHWLIDRCFKTNAMGNVMMRPIFRRKINANDKNGGIFVENPGYAPKWLIEYYTETLRRDGPKSIKAKALYTLIQLRIKKLHRVFYKDSTHISFDETSFLQARSHVLQYLLDRFDTLAKAHNTKILFFHMHQYTNFFDRDAGNIEHDSCYFQQCVNNETLFYQPPYMMEAALKAHETTLLNQSLVESIHCPDNNHPNEKGHRIIADCILKTLIEKRL
ncbi:MAG: SGNH/GDSL hydrolase family protein [Bdellovibrionales bacterium]